MTTQNVEIQYEIIMLHSIKATQTLNSTLDEIWGFMSDPSNLKVITPPHMRFKVLSETAPIYAGQVIEYHVSPLLGIKMHWVTEITHVVEGAYFVDEQRVGPYSFWHHQHFIKQVASGVEMTDIVYYKIPLGAIGRMMNSLFIKKQLQGIFEYRHNKLDELFNTSNIK